MSATLDASSGNRQVTYVVVDRYVKNNSNIGERKGDSRGTTSSPYSRCTAQSSHSVDLAATRKHDVNFSLPLQDYDDDAEINSNHNSRKRTRIILSSVLSAGMLLLIIAFIFCMQRRNQLKEIVFRRTNGRLAQYKFREQELPLFDLATLANATNTFCTTNKLGEGGFGPVYKGTLEDGQQIAVKRLSKNSRQGLDEFMNEVMHIVKLQHRNLVKLLGCCIEAEEKMLVYEFMPNKSLDHYIFDETQSKLLDWPLRYSIINGIARGLLYLHQDSRLRIVHRDLKASNVLLDHEMNPKISDFGMARSFGEDLTVAKTNKVVGTYGYMSPEYAVHGRYSAKSDVFSFGVLVLETVSGKRNRGFSHPDHYFNLIGHAWRLFREDKALELVAEWMVEPCYFSEVIRAIHIGLLCVQEIPEDRPSMSTVVLMMGSEGTLPPPTQPGFFSERDLLEENSSSPQAKPYSTNQCSISLVDGR
ncbi:G-type lectin S-receptor-like serine/threonine-protein kinase SD1-1 [Turnera subulata]|uniref:non-specific serine/threonine protein kinase n=1 Tax=Turnera subulata TaxID=218843 RepID=A0A9Q0FD83_9ROSI|nr:G-type lectin S-receptor-like serine/threonine-protein kinase SD1-1 [Turnera subulata]